MSLDLHKPSRPNPRDTPQSPVGSLRLPVGRWGRSLPPASWVGLLFPRPRCQREAAVPRCCLSQVPGPVTEVQPPPRQNWGSLTVPVPTPHLTHVSTPGFHIWNSQQMSGLPSRQPVTHTVHMVTLNTAQLKVTQSPAVTPRSAMFSGHALLISTKCYTARWSRPGPGRKLRTRQSGAGPRPAPALRGRPGKARQHGATLRRPTPATRTRGQGP